MNKKLFLPLTIVPLLTSCSGFPISRADAIKIIESVEYNANENCKTSYTSTRVSTTGEVENTVVSYYSRENKFFHTYTISTQNSGRISESWRFVKDYQKDNVTKTYIFDVSRNITPSSVTETLDKQYVVTYKEYKDELWNEYANEYENRLSRAFADAIEHARELIVDESKYIELYSYNGMSLFLQSKQETQGTSVQAAEYELKVSNGKLMSIKSVNGETSKTETSYVYSAGDITYPDFKIAIL